MSYEDTEGENIAQTLARELPKPEVVNEDGTGGGTVLQIAVPGSMKLVEVDNERLLPGPRRAKSAPHFGDHKSFLAYISRHAAPSTVVWCNFNPQTFALDFRAVLDDHQLTQPGWRGHSAIFAPDFSAEWKAWEGSNTKPMAQVTFAEWLQEHGDDINSGAEGMPTSLAMLKMATEFVANEEHVLKSAVKLQSGGVRLTYVADADTNTQATMEVFEKFALGIPVFHGCGAWGMNARLKYATSQGRVNFRYELIRPDVVHNHAAQELITAIREGLGGTPMLMGTCA